MEMIPLEEQLLQSSTTAPSVVSTSINKICTSCALFLTSPCPASVSTGRLPKGADAGRRAMLACLST